MPRARAPRPASLAWPRYILIAVTLLFAVHARAEIPTVLTDTVNKGSGTIDLMKDASASELQEVLDGGTLYLGVDLNEAADGLESSTTQGVAIEEMELVLVTTEGEFTFTSFYTSTTAMITAEGSTEASEYHTLFGSTGSNDLTSDSGFDITSYDDVVEIQSVEYTGEIISAQLNVTFLDTADDGGANEEFFDFSNGFEELAILSGGDAEILETAAVGEAEAPEGLSYESETGAADVAAPSGAPEPPWLVLALVPVLWLWRQRRDTS